MASPKLLIDGPKRAVLTLALAHGAGAPMDSPFMTAMAEGLANEGIRVARFEFPYMAARRSSGKKKPPDRAPILMDCWRAVIDEFGQDKLVVGGKSMGGRFASMIAAALEQEGGPVRGVVCLGYPFRAPGKPVGNRIDHLKAIKTPVLICQGTRDPFGGRDDVKGYRLPNTVRVQWLEDGNHDFAPRKSSGRTAPQNIAEAVAATAAFLGKL